MRVKRNLLFFLLSVFILHASDSYGINTNADFSATNEALFAVSFTTNPAVVGGAVTICLGQSITFTDISTEVAAGAVYLWSFPGGNTSTLNTPGPHTITYTTAGNYTATLTINGLSASVNVEVLNKPPSNPVIELISGNNWGVSTFNGKQYFTFCSNDSNTNGGLFSFTTNSTNTISTTQHTFDWGDGQNDTVLGSNLGDTFHFYQNSGIYTLTYTVKNSTGCNSVKSYNIYVGASPSATINHEGVPVLCAPGSVTYNILPGAQNSPNTVYKFEVNDGSPAVFFNHPPPATYTHNYTTTSCGTTSTINGTAYPNSFQASITASNPCGISSSAFGPINIQMPPDANFTRTPNDGNICKGTTVEFNDTTTGGENIGGAPNYTCTKNYKKYWVIVGPAGNIAVNSSGVLVPNTFITATGNFGYNNNQPNNSGAWIPTASSKLNITFNTAGVYTVTLYTGSNTCGITSEIQTFCVNPEVIADFTLSPTSGCSPATVQTDNLSSFPGCSNSNLYEWQVTSSNPDSCPDAITPGWSFTSGDARAFEPEITFTSPGVYTVALTTSLQNPVSGALCQSDLKTETITIKGKPTTTLTPQTICEGSTIVINPTVYNCYASDDVTYVWDFGSTPPTSISSSTAANPTVTFATVGTYNYTLTLTNECGSNIFSSSITVNPAVQISASGPTATCLNTSIQLDGSITGGTTSGTWTTSVTGGSFSPSNTTLSPTYTPPLNFTGTIVFTLTSDDPPGLCPLKTESFTVIFNAQATADTGTYNPVCQNGSLQLNGIVGGAASTGSWTSLIGGTFSDANSLTSTYSPPVGFTGTIDLVLTTNDPDGPCNPETDTVTVTFIPTPTINTINDVVVCHDGIVGPISFSGTNATNYSWTNSNTNIGLVATGTGAISFTATNSGTIPISGTITVTPLNTSGGTSCSGTSITFTITVNPAGTVNPILNQVVCHDDTVTVADFSTDITGGTTTYAWLSSNTAIGLVASGTGNIAGFTATNTGNAPLSSVITVVPTFRNGSVSCQGSSATFTITVNPTAQVNQLDNQLFCAGSATIPITFTTTNTVGITTYNWTNDTAGIGIGTSGTGNIPTFTPINNTTSPITATITVTPTFSNGGTSCTGPAKTFTITINPKGQVNTISNIVVCNGDTIPVISFSTTTTGGATTYSWTNNQPTIGIIGTGSGDITSFTAINSGTSPVVATISVTPSFTNSVSCTGTPITFTVTINPSAHVNTVTNKTVCNNETQAAIAFATANTRGTTTYSWTNDMPSIGLGASGTGNIPAFTAINSGTSPITATIVVTPSYAHNGITCSGVSTTFTIVVNPSGQVNAILNQILCNGISTNAVTFSTINAGGTTMYSWINSNTAIGLPASGSGTIDAFNVTNTTASPITATITVTPSFANGTSFCSGPTQSFTITVNPSPAVSFSQANQTICSGDTSAVVSLSSTTPGATFSWESVQPVGITGVRTSGTDSIPAQTLVNNTNAPITITYTAITSTNDASACAGSSYTYTITVNPRPSITESYTDSICSGGTFSILPSNSSLNSIPVGTTYSWGAPVVTGGLTGGASGVNQTSITVTLVNPTNTAQTAIYTVTPIFNGCSGSTFTVTISVNPKPVIADVVHPAICSETTFSVKPNHAGVTIVPIGTTYTWTLSTNANITGQSASSAAGITSIGQTLTNLSNTTQTITYTVTPTSGDTGNCVGTPFTITVTVSPKPFVADHTSTICSGTAFSVIPTHGSGSIVPAGTTYTWTTPVSNPVGAITGGSSQLTGISGIGQTVTNTTNAPATLEYTVIPTVGACVGNPFTITVTVNPIPTTLGLINQTYCNAVSTSEIVFGNEVLGTTYSWTNSNTAIGLSASGTGNIPLFTPTNTTAAPITGTISVIATANGCSRASETFTITVNPSPAVSFSQANQTICSGDTSAVVTLSSATSGATFTWEALQPVGITGVITSGTDSIPAQTLVNNTNAPIIITYTATASTNDSSACAGSSYTYTITVNPRPNIENYSMIICSEEIFTVSPVNSILDATTIVPSTISYSWIVSSNSNITGASNASGTKISQTLVNTSAVIQTIMYTVTPVSGTCSGSPFTITIEVYPKPDVLFDLSNQEICNATTTNEVRLSTSFPEATSFAWSASIPSGISGAIASGTDTIPPQTLINTTNTPLTVTYTASGTFSNGGSSCYGKEAVYTITVNPTFIVSGIVSNYNGYNVSLFGGNDGGINLTVSGGSPEYEFSWVGPNGFISTSQNLMGLQAGTYTVTVTDGYCQPIVLTFILSQPPELLVQQDLRLSVDLLCFGDSNGAVGVLIIQESVSPYNYTLLDSSNTIVTSISNSSNFNPQFTGLVAGIYSVRVSDGNGGVKIVTGLVVSQPVAMSIDVNTTDISCYGANDAIINLSVTGGNGPYQAKWSNLATGLYQDNLAAGIYDIIVTDANGCSKSIAITVKEAPVFVINPIVVNISCFGANDGSINLNLVGGKAPVKLTWADGSTSGTVRNNLAPGAYTVSISDGKPCYIESTFIIVEPQPLVLSATVQNAFECDNVSSGAVNLVVAGGTPPFTYNWSNGDATEDIVNVPNGNYSVVVTDSRGCVKTASYSVFRPQPIMVMLNESMQVDCENKNIEQSFMANVYGGIPPYKLSWSSGVISGANNEIMNPVSNGTVVLTATDSYNCSQKYTFTVDMPRLGTFSFDANSYAYATYGVYSIIDPIQFNSTITGDYVSILWDFGDGTISDEQNPTHVYNAVGNYVVTETVTYPFGCVYLKTIALKVEKGYVLELPDAFTPNNDGINDFMRPVYRGLKTIRFDVYDSWGGLIYAEEGETIRGWDGKIKGVQAENGNYYYKVYGTTFYNQVVEKSHPFTLIK